MSDHYAMLGVPRNASQQEIKRAWRRLASKHHPDHGGDSGVMASIQNAYDVLSDPKKRELYDLGGDDAVKMGDDIEAAAISKLKNSLHQLIHASASMDDQFGVVDYDPVNDLRDGVKETVRQIKVSIVSHEKLVKKLKKMANKRRSKKNGANNFYEQAVAEQIDGMQKTVFTLNRELKIAEKALELIDDLELEGQGKLQTGRMFIGRMIAND